MSYLLGLTGGIATGKSHLSGVLREAGAWIVDADGISRALTAPGGEALPLIRKGFGDSVFHDDGTLDRKALGALVFGDAGRLQKLNDIMHPLIFGRMHTLIAEADEAGAPVTVLDVPLLYETRLDRICREVWCAWIPRDIQLKRLMARDGLTRAQAEARIRSQMSAWEKRTRADRYIDTRGSLEESAATVLGMYRELTERLAKERADAQNG